MKSKISNDNNSSKKSVLLAWNEEGYNRIHFSKSKVLISQGKTSTSNKTIANFTHSIMEVGSNFYGFYNRFSNDSKEA